MRCGAGARHNAAQPSRALLRLRMCNKGTQKCRGVLSVPRARYVTPHAHCGTQHGPLHDSGPPPPAWLRRLRRRFTETVRNKCRGARRDPTNVCLLSWSIVKSPQAAVAAGQGGRGWGIRGSLDVCATFGIQIQHRLLRGCLFPEQVEDCKD